MSKSTKATDNIYPQGLTDIKTEVTIQAVKDSIEVWRESAERLTLDNMPDTSLQLLDFLPTPVLPLERHPIAHKQWRKQIDGIWKISNNPIDEVEGRLRYCVRVFRLDLLAVPQLELLSLPKSLASVLTQTLKDNVGPLMLTRMSPKVIEFKTIPEKDWLELEFFQSSEALNHLQGTIRF